MKLHAIFFVIICVALLPAHAQQANRLCNGHKELWDKRYNEVTYVHAHNLSLYKKEGWQYPSIDANQNLGVRDLLKIGVRSMKTPVHYEEDYGCHQGKNPMAAHGVYRNTFYKGYYAAFGKIVDKVLAEHESNELAKIILGAVKWEFDRYIAGLEPIAQSERDAREVTYGSSDKKAILPFRPCDVDPSARPLWEVLDEVRGFLIDNPNEVVTFEVEDVTGNLDVIAQEFEWAELIDYVHVQDKNELWPTLGEMVTSGKRLVVLINTKDAQNKYPWLTYTGDFVWSSKWNYQTKEELLADKYLPQDNSNFQRRHENPRNTLCSLTNSLTWGLAGDPLAARQVNMREVLQQRYANIAGQANSRANYISVDFVELPNKEVFDFVDSLNGVSKDNQTSESSSSCLIQ